ncbi:MAG TPA: potassium-transporting ATPase subunit KdpC [Candidatus Binataceae bacterium]|nr:potassium-transporting ATPase subunit KdpC [Candidatus Binataceae bacterium]
MRALLIAIRMTIVLTILTGLIYPLAMVGIAHVIFPWQSAGSIATRNGQVVGAASIGQNFASPRYFHSRPSAAGDKGYDATSSSGSNLGPTNKILIDTVRKRLKDELETDPGVTTGQVPVDLVTASGSGLDPEISPAAAEIQVARVAKTRGLSQDVVEQLVQQNTRGRWLGILGEPGVNVLALNLALDDAAAKK